MTNSRGPGGGDTDNDTGAKFRINTSLIVRTSIRRIETILNASYLLPENMHFNTWDQFKLREITAKWLFMKVFYDKKHGICTRRLTPWLRRVLRVSVGVLIPTGTRRTPISARAHLQLGGSLVPRSTRLWLKLPHPYSLGLRALVMPKPSQTTPKLSWQAFRQCIVARLILELGSSLTALPSEIWSAIGSIMVWSTDQWSVIMGMANGPKWLKVDLLYQSLGQVCNSVESQGSKVFNLVKVENRHRWTEASVN